jgi:hypothetical protein
LGYNADELREIFRLIDWMMHLTEALSLRFEQDLRELEETLNMPYVTSVERIAESRGEARGEARGKALGEARGRVSLLLRQLAKVCGPLPEDVADRIRDLPNQQIETLGEALLDFHSPADLQTWLELNEDPAR